MKIKAFFISLCLLPGLAKSQMQQLNAADIAQGLSSLSVQGSVLYIAAHPDDENTRLLAYLAKEVKVRTAYLSLTRGDGGQNLIGNEQGELLGQIRTQELIAARKVDGAEQFFSRANDFGFSKTADETFKIWGKQQILADAVWVIRKFKPDVIITRFPEDKRAGHGHHAASAIIAREAFFAAADPKQFPEQLKLGVSTWQARRLLWNTYNFGTTNTTAADQLKINVGVYNPLLGKNYGEIAAVSRTSHKSQGFGSTLQRGEAFEYFIQTAGSPAKNSIFDGININLSNAKIVALLKEIEANYNVYQPSVSVPNLLKLKKMAATEVAFKHQLLDELIFACAGVWADATVNQPYHAIGDSILVNVNAIYRSSIPLEVSAEVQHEQVSLRNNRLKGLKYKFKAEANDLTQPYYLKKNHPIGFYNIDHQQEVGLPENLPIAAEINLVINGETFKLSLPILYKNTDPIQGEQYQPLVIAPKVTATFNEQAYLFTNDDAKTINVRLRSFTENAVGELRPVLPSGWMASPEKIPFKLAKKNEEQLVAFSITPNKNATEAELTLEVQINNTVETRELKTIAYPHIPNINLFPSANAKLRVVDLKIAGKRIAYLDGAGDLVAQTLQQVGYEVTTLSTAQVLSEDISVYDAIITGVRFFNVNEKAGSIRSALMEYVTNGGVLLEQYNVNTGLKAINFGPYNFTISKDRVTEEDATVTFVNPAHAALNYPNKINNKDFEGWVQERGLYFLTALDPKYDTILKMNDTDEPQHKGALITVNYGKGKFVYTSLSFFRQLPAGVSGAYRLFANLLAKPQ